MSEEVKATNVTWHQHSVSRDDREKACGHKSCVLWFTGLSASGKSTIAQEVQAALFERGVKCYVLDGDNIRHGLNKDLGFSPADREENIRRIGEVAKLFADAGTIAITAFISPYRADRDKARALCPDSFIEVFVKCGIDVCETRDPKGLYKKARAGQIPEFTGISAPYEEPLAPELVVDNGAMTLEDSTRTVLGYLAQRGIIQL